MNPKQTFRPAAALAAFAALATAQDAPRTIEYGRLEITGYELREVRFDRPFRVLEPGKPEQLFAAGWHIVVHGKEFPVRALDPILWVGDVPLRNYEREVHVEGQSLAFVCVDPALLRAERDLTVIYGEDPRTRTRLLERLDPERMVRLPAAERAAADLPELEGVTLRVGADGRIAGEGRLEGGRLAVAARLTDGTLSPLADDVRLDARGRFALGAVALPERATHVVALRLEGEVGTAGLELAKLPRGVEVLDSKPVAREGGGR